MISIIGFLGLEHMSGSHSGGCLAMSFNKTAADCPEFNGIAAGIAITHLKAFKDFLTASFGTLLISLLLSFSAFRAFSAFQRFFAELFSNLKFILFLYFSRSYALQNTRDFRNNKNVARWIALLKIKDLNRFNYRVA